MKIGIHLRRYYSNSGTFSVQVTCKDSLSNKCPHDSELILRHRSVVEGGKCLFKASLVSNVDVKSCS